MFEQGVIRPPSEAQSLLIRRSSSVNYPVDVVLDERVMKEVLPETEKLEQGDPDSFNRHIETLMAYMIPQPRTDEEWD